MGYMKERISLPEYQDLSPEMQAAFDAQVHAHGRMTNMKKTLTHSRVAFRSLMSWYELREEILPFLGERLVNLFAHAISHETDCLICSTFFRRILVESGENPDQLVLSARESLVVAYGRQLVKNPLQVSDDLFKQLQLEFRESELVSITAFAGLMIATNVFNNALRIPLDEYLMPYKKEAHGK